MPEAERNSRIARLLSGNGSRLRVNQVVLVVFVANEIGNLECAGICACRGEFGRTLGQGDIFAAVCVELVDGVLGACRDTDACLLPLTFSPRIGAGTPRG